ncbi:MAG: SIMPL domain-containing protein [Anaerolineae bacterium]
MKTWASVAVVVLAVALSLILGRGAGPAGTIAAAQDDGDRRTITVSGEAQVRVVPDEVAISLGVETRDKEMQQAKAGNDEIVRRVIAAAQEHGIEARDIKTDYLSIEPRYRDAYDDSDFADAAYSVPLGYIVRATIVVTLREVTAFDDVLSSLLEAGATHVHGIDFRTTSLRQHRDDARSLAIQAASEKAQAMAGALAQTIGEPTSIVEEQAGWWSWYGSWWGSSYSSMTQNVVQSVGQPYLGEDSTLAPGEIAVTARVSVVFELE